MLVVAVGAIAAGTFGPVYLGEADHSVLLSTLAEAPVGNNGITLLPSRGPDARTRLLRVSDEASHLFGSPTFGGRALLGSPIVTEDIGVTTTAPTNGQLYGSDLVARTDVCRHLSFGSGGCPVAPASVAVSTRSAQALGLHTGDRLTLFATRSNKPITLTISGLFRPGDPQAPFWWGENYFPKGEGFSTSKPLLDDFFAGAQTVLAVAPPGQVALMTQLPLTDDALVPGNVGPFEAMLSRLESQAPTDDAVGVSSQVVRQLDRAAQDEHTTDTIVIVVDLQLVLLSLLVLYFVAARTAEAREPDVRLAELRGFAPSDAALVALLEPLTILGLSVPLGILVAWLAAVVASPHLFVQGVGPALAPLAVGAAVLSFAAGVLATVLGARQLIFRRGAPRHQGPGAQGIAIAVDAVAVTLAVVAFVEVAAGGVSSGSHTDPLAAFAPGLLAFGIGVLAARLLPLASRLAVRATRGSRRVGTALAVSRIARRAELSRHIVLVSLSVGLATFAIAGWTVAGHNRFLDAGFDVGASRVLVVNVPPGVDFLSAVRRADPGGSRAMAVVIERAPDGVTLAVDSARMADVASWPSTLSTTGVRALARLIAPRTAPVVTVRGDALRVSVDVAGNVEPALELQAVVFDNSFQELSTVDLGALRVDRHSYQGSLVGDCSPACRLAGLAVTWTPPGSVPQQSTTIPFQVTSIADRSDGGSWSTVPAGLGDPHDWASSSSAVTVGRDGSALTVDATVDADGSPATFGPTDVPHTLPAIVTGSGSGSGPGATAVGLDGSTITVRSVALVPALPVIGNGNGATMVDLPLAQRLQSGPMLNATPEVWLAPGPDHDVVQRLRADGITVVEVHTVTALLSLLSKTGVSLAYALFLVSALVAAVLAVASTIFAVSVTARRRMVEFASLRAVGIRPRTLRRSLALEQVLVLGVGVVAGVIATAVALPSIPENFTLGPAPPLAFGLPLGAIGVIIVAVVVSLGVTVAVAARLVVGRASVDTLGGGQ
jgi:hypothetical protein